MPSPPTTPNPAAYGADRLAQLELWRLAARRVARAWDLWLAAEAEERDWARDVYEHALAEEERAAERLEREAHGG